MTTLGLGSAGVPSGEVTGHFRTGGLKHVRVALSSAGGAAVIFALFELLQKQPADGFKLLAEWGPWPIIALVALALIAPFLSAMNDTVRTAFGSIVANFEQQTQATSKQAEALTRLADQGSRQSEQIERLVIYSAQEWPGVYDRFDRQDEVLQKLTEALVDLRAHVGQTNGG